MLNWNRFEAAAERVGINWNELLRIKDLHQENGQATIWNYPEMACLSVGGKAEDTEPAELAMFCSVYSIRLIDDILDDDPLGQQHRLGVGRTANLAMAFQSLGALLLKDLNVTPEKLDKIESLYHLSSIHTAYGQDLDAQIGDGEAAYWRITEAKTPPLFSAAFEMGALIGGSNPEQARQLALFGHALAMHVQVSDDLSDALETPARDDWQRPSNNLAILYAMTVDHPERDNFVSLIPKAKEPALLMEAQEILTRSGGVSYCAFKMIEQFRELSEIFYNLDIPNPGPLRGLLHDVAAAVQALFMAAGVPHHTARDLLVA